MAAAGKVAPVLRGGPQRRPQVVRGMGEGKEGQETFLVPHGGGEGRAGEQRWGWLSRVLQQALGHSDSGHGTWAWASRAAVRGRTYAVGVWVLGFAFASQALVFIGGHAHRQAAQISRDCLVWDGQSLQS